MKRAIVVLTLVVLVAGCFPDPVEESLLIAFGDGEEITVENVTEIHDDAGENTQLAARLSMVRDELIAERDPWSLRFARLSPDEESYKREKAAGKVSRVTRTARVTENDLVRLLSDFATINLVSGNGWRQLTITTARSERATSRQKSDVDRQLAEWTHKYVNYLTATMQLYGYLDEQPLRARPVFMVLFGDLMPEPAPEDKPLLTEDEQQLIANVRAMMDELSNAMSDSGGGAYTFEELTRLVYDPFPCDITIRVNGSVLDSEGFEKTDAETVKIPKLSLEGSLLQLEDRWITPDPFLARLRVDPDQGSFNLNAFLEKERGMSPLPSPDAMRKAIDDVLTPGNKYRVRWEER